MSWLLILERKQKISSNAFRICGFGNACLISLLYMRRRALGRDWERSYLLPLIVHAPEVIILCNHNHFKNLICKVGSHSVVWNCRFFGLAWFGVHSKQNFLGTFWTRMIDQVWHFPIPLVFHPYLTPLISASCVWKELTAWPVLISQTRAVLSHPCRR